MCALHLITASPTIDFNIQFSRGKDFTRLREAFVSWVLSIKDLDWKCSVKCNKRETFSPT